MSVWNGTDHFAVHGSCSWPVILFLLFWLRMQIVYANLRFHRIKKKKKKKLSSQNLGKLWRGMSNNWLCWRNSELLDKYTQQKCVSNQRCFSLSSYSALCRTPCRSWCHRGLWKENTLSLVSPCKTQGTWCLEVASCDLHSNSLLSARLPQPLLSLLGLRAQPCSQVCRREGADQGHTQGGQRKVVHPQLLVVNC